MYKQLNTYAKDIMKPFYCSSPWQLCHAYLLRLDLTRIRNMIMKFAPIPRPATRKMMPAALSAFSWHSITLTLDALLIGSVMLIPAPGMPRETVLPRWDEDMTVYTQQLPICCDGW